MMFLVFSLLEPNEIALCSRVCKGWNKDANSEQLWQTICSRFGIDSSKGKTWKEQYVRFAAPARFSFFVTITRRKIIVSCKNIANKSLEEK